MWSSPHNKQITAPRFLARQLSLHGLQGFQRVKQFLYSVPLEKKATALAGQSACLLLRQTHTEKPPPNTVSTVPCRCELSPLFCRWEKQRQAELDTDSPKFLLQASSGAGTMAWGRGLMLTQPHRYSCAGKGLMLAQDPFQCSSLAPPGFSSFLDTVEAWMQARDRGLAGLQGLWMLGSTAPLCLGDMGILPRRVPLGTRARTWWQVRESGGPTSAASGDW